MEDIFNYLRRNILLLLVILMATCFGGYYFLNHTKPPVKNEIQTTATPVKKTTPKKSETSKILVVDVTGAVKNSGVYRAKSGAIVQELIQMAGGLADNADSKQINQAQRITDQMQIYVPYQGEKSTPVANKATGANKETKKVNINSATVDDFKNVTGIGPKKAEKIIAFREKNGNFNELHDLTKVSGIGEKSLESLKDQLTV